MEFIRDQQVITTSGFWKDIVFTFVKGDENEAEVYSSKYGQKFFPLDSLHPAPTAVAAPPAEKTRKQTFVSYTNASFAYECLHSAGTAGIIADTAVRLLEERDGDGKPKVNKVAPAFTNFKDLGIAEETGFTTQTRNGGSAKLLRLTANAEQRFLDVYGKLPKQEVIPCNN